MLRIKKNIAQIVFIKIYAMGIVKDIFKKYKNRRG